MAQQSLFNAPDRSKPDSKGKSKGKSKGNGKPRPAKVSVKAHERAYPKRGER